MVFTSTVRSHEERIIFISGHNNKCLTSSVAVPHFGHIVLSSDLSTFGVISLRNERLSVHWYCHSAIVLLFRCLFMSIEEFILWVDADADWWAVFAKVSFLISWDSYMKGCVVK